MSDRETEVGELARAGAGAVLIAVGVNAALYLVGDAMGAFPLDALPPGPEGRALPITLGSVVILSTSGPAIGVALYAVLDRFTDRAWMVFLWIAGAALLLMAIPPLQIENAPAQVVMLEIMHLVTAAATIGMVGRTRQAGG